MKRIIAFVGPTGAGKTTLILELVRHMSDRLSVVKSLTTRARRGPEDDQFYQFVPREEIRKREADGRLLQVSEYAGNLYANDKVDLDHLLEYKIGLMALVEDSVPKFRNAGYQLTVIRVVPKDHPKTADVLRAQADASRAAIPLDADLELENSFRPGGKETAIRSLIEFIHRTLA